MSPAKRKPPPAKAPAPPAGPVQVALRVPPEMLTALDAWVEELNEKRTWPKLTRTDVMRQVLEKAIRDRWGVA